MMDKERTGGEAFPVPGSGLSTGMTLRDYFAAKAMQGMLANSRTEGTMAADVIDAAWAVADAMLEARK